MKMLGPQKTDNAIDKSSRDSGGEDKIGENFDVHIKRATQSSSHSHRSTVADQSIVMADLRVVKPFSRVPNRMHDSFPDFTETIYFNRGFAWRPCCIAGKIQYYSYGTKCSF